MNGTLQEATIWESARWSIKDDGMVRELNELETWSGEALSDWFTISPVSETNLDQFIGTFRVAVGTPYEGGPSTYALNRRALSVSASKCVVPDEYCAPKHRPAGYSLDGYPFVSRTLVAAFGSHKVGGVHRVTA